MATAATVVVTEEEALLLAVELPAGAAGAENPRMRPISLSDSVPAAAETEAMHAMAATRSRDVYRGMVQVVREWTN